MYSISNIIWNQISAEYELKTEWAKRMFSHPTQEELNKALEIEIDKLKEQGVSGKIALAVITVLPLLLENEAIRKINNNEKWVPPITEVENLEEAIYIAAHEYRTLTEKDLNQMRKIVQSIIDNEEMNFILDDINNGNFFKKKKPIEYPITEEVLYTTYTDYFSHKGFKFVIDSMLPEHAKEHIKNEIKNIIDNMK